MISTKFGRQLSLLIRNGTPLIRPAAFAVRPVATDSTAGSEFTKIEVPKEVPKEVPSFAPITSDQIKTIKLDDRKLVNVNTGVMPVREAWIENMYSPNSIKLGLLELHPQIFSAFPRVDVIQENYKWQTLYKHVNWECMPTRAEVKGANQKPWPQKGGGRARHGSRKSPQWIRGGWAYGPRGPRTYFYMLPWNKRVTGLVSMLSLKFSQDDIKIVDSFEGFPTEGTSDHVQELCETRGWGPSVLFVDKLDVEEAPRATKVEHFENAMKDVNHINILPVYGLNVYSMLKHETMVLTLAAVKEIEERLLFQLNRIDLRTVEKKVKPDGVYRL